MKRAHRHRVAGTIGLLLTAGVSGVASQTAGSPGTTSPDAIPWHFSVGESHEYVVGLGRMKVGRGRLAVEAYRVDEEIPRYRISLHIEAGAAFFRTEHLLESWIATDPLRSLTIEKSIREGGDRSRHRYELDYATRTARTLEWDERADSVRPTASETAGAIPDPALDEVALLYLLRLLPLGPGASYRLDSFYRPDGNPVSFRVLGREKVRVPAGSFHTVVVEPVLPSMGMFDGEANARLYLSDDDRRIIVKITTTSRLGTVALHLRSYDEGEPPKVRSARP